MRIALFRLSLTDSMALVSDVLMRISTERIALSNAKNGSRGVIKPVGIFVFTKGHIFIPMHDFDTLVRPVESQHIFGNRVFKTGSQPSSIPFGLGNTPVS